MESSRTRLTTQQWILDNWVLLIVIAGCVFITVAVFVESGLNQIANTIVSGALLALVSVGLALIMGVMNIPQFAHGESFMVGAFVAYFVYSPINDYLVDHPNPLLINLAPFAGIAAAAIAGFVLGVLLELILFTPLRRRTKENWVMNSFLLTVGISFILVNGVTLTIGPNFRGIPSYWPFEPLEFLGIRIAFDRVVVFFIAIITFVLFWLFMQRTRTGRAIRAVSQDETGSEMVGINLTFIFRLTFGLATAMAAMAGACLLFIYQAYPTVGLKPLYLSWYVVMLVGMGNVAGAFFGGFIVALLQTGTQQFFGIAWEDVVPTIVMILVLLIAPSGIFGSEVKGVQEQ
jgi:branched-chain amino acid transport system permease protein